MNFKSILKSIGTCLLVLTACEKQETNPNVELPTISTIQITDITNSSAISGGIITSDGGGIIIDRGVCWSTSQNPTISDLKIRKLGTLGEFVIIITDLRSETNYSVRAYATNQAGTAYGNQLNFTTTTTNITFNPDLTYGTMQDIEGNTYKTIQIGTQTWMAENLRTRKYNDGTAIPIITDNSAWAVRSTPAFCWYDNDKNQFSTTYGALYNWWAVNTSKLCPSGWHVPSDTDWTTLTTFLGGPSVAGDKMKETGTTHWLNPNGGTNSSGFSGVPGGNRSAGDGAFSQIGYYGYWWSSNDFNDGAAWYLSYDEADLSRTYASKFYGFSVRCLRD